MVTPSSIPTWIQLVSQILLMIMVIFPNKSYSFSPSVLFQRNAFSTTTTSSSSRTTTTHVLQSSPKDHSNSSISSSSSRRKFFNTIITSTTTTTAIISSNNIQPSYATYTDPNTKIVLPSINEIESSLPKQWYEDDNPFTNLDTKTAFSRLDTKPDSIFYTDPRFVEHVDDQAVTTMTNYISSSSGDGSGGGVLKKGDAVLDLCTSWTSHITLQTKEELNLSRVSGLGMNEEEMKRNTVLDDYVVVDLNEKQQQKQQQQQQQQGEGEGRILPYDDETFDVVLCQLSIDYLTRPLEVMKDVGRVLKRGGKVVILFSNRLFLQKAVGLWTGADDIDHTYTVGSYLNYCNGNFINIEAKDLSVRKKVKGKQQESMIIGDPLYSVTAIKG